MAWIEKIRHYCNKTKKLSCNLAKMQDPRGLNIPYKRSCQLMTRMRRMTRSDFYDVSERKSEFSLLRVEKCENVSII